MGNEKRPTDTNKKAKSIVDIAIGVVDDTSSQDAANQQ